MARAKDYLVTGIIAAVVFSYLMLSDLVCSKSYIIADRNTGIYHLPSCGVLKDANPDDIISFTESIYNSDNFRDAAADAREAGYMPCTACSPPAAEEDSLQ